MKNLKEVFYHTSNSTKKSTNKVSPSDFYSTFSLLSLKDYNRYKRFDRNGQLISFAIVDSISISDTRARFSSQKWLEAGEWRKDSIQLNPIQEQWKFYGYKDKKRTLIKERNIEYYSNQEGIIKGVPSEIEHLDSSNDSIFGNNINSIMKCNGVFTMFQSIYIPNEKEALTTPKILYQTYILDRKNIGTSKEYFPYSGEIAREIEYKDGEIVKVICYSYNNSTIQQLENKSIHNYTNITYNKTLFKNNKMYVYDIEGNLVFKRRKKLNNKVPLCQCDNAYFERAYFYIDENRYIKPFLDRQGAENY